MLGCMAMDYWYRPGEREAEEKARDLERRKRQIARALALRKAKGLDREGNPTDAPPRKH